MEEDDLLEQFAQSFPKLYEMTVSYALSGEDSVYILLNDGRTVKFQSLDDGISLQTM